MKLDVRIWTVPAASKSDQNECKYLVNINSQSFSNLMNIFGQLDGGFDKIKWEDLKNLATESDKIQCKLFEDLSCGF